MVPVSCRSGTSATRRPGRAGPLRIRDCPRRGRIDRALQGPRPYELLGYHPAIADPAGLGTHGTTSWTSRPGTAEPGRPTRLPPDADLIFVHLADRNTGGLANFGDSVRLLEAVDLSRHSRGQPCVINISAGRICGPKDGTTLVERAFDELFSATPGGSSSIAPATTSPPAHARGTIAPGEARSLSFVVDPADITLDELEIWFDGAASPPSASTRLFIREPCHLLGERSTSSPRAASSAGCTTATRPEQRRLSHRRVHRPIGHAGNWTVTLEARRVSSGRFHAWIERDDSCPGCQARFTRADSNSATTIGSITTSHLPLIVGAYNGHDPGRPAAPFSSRGPSRDLRPKPDLAAPGVAVLAARSAPIIASRSPGLLTRKSGTSMATPHVTGAVALCLQAAGTRLSAHQIRSLVLGSCDPAPDSDPCRLGRGYLNIPRLIAGVQQALAAPASTRGAKEPTMDTEDIIALLAAAPATAYREYLYRPHGQFARWIGDRFEVVAKPGQRIGRAPQAGDVLLQVRLGRIHLGRCIVLGDRDHRLAATPPKLAPGQLLLRPRRRAALTEPLPVEPAAEIPYLALSPAAEPWAASPRRSHRGDHPRHHAHQPPLRRRHRSRRRRQRHAAAGRAGHVTVPRAGALPRPGHRKDPAGADRPQLPAASARRRRPVRRRDRRRSDKVQDRPVHHAQRPRHRPPHHRLTRHRHHRARPTHTPTAHTGTGTGTAAATAVAAATADPGSRRSRATLPPQPAGQGRRAPYPAG